MDPLVLKSALYLVACYCEATALVRLGIVATFHVSAPRHFDP
jgi:hypothetical protein